MYQSDIRKCYTFNSFKQKAVKNFRNICANELDAISTLEKLIIDSQPDIHELQTKFNSTSTSPAIDPNCVELIMNEINRRKYRENNIIISGVPQTEPENIADKVSTSIKSVSPLTNMTNVKIYRLGTKNTANTRPFLTKVCFTNKESSSIILRSAKKYKKVA